MEDELDVPGEGQETKGELDTSPIKLSLAKRIILVKIEDEHGEEKDYELREMRGKQRDKYLTEQAGRAKYSNGVAVGVKDLDNFQASLLAKCLYDVGTQKLVPISTIENWPSHVQDSLYEAGMRLSALDKGAKERAKNS